MSHIVFAQPQYLFLLLLIIPAIVWYVLKQYKLNATVQVSTIRFVEKAPRTVKHYLRHVPFGIRMFVLALLIIIIARPQSTNSSQNVLTEGIDVMMAIDISGSMLAEDFKPNRLEAAKEVATEFIGGRRDDKIGLVVFAGESFTQCPLTTDHAVLINLFKDIESGMIEDGTAIGLGLANAVNRLRESQAKSKVVILLTDGVNNMGDIAPVTASDIARTYGVRVYTIGVGTRGQAPFPFKTQLGKQYRNVEVKIDEEVLQQIAQMTGGKYFRATDNSKLKEIYQEIDKMEKSKIEVRQFSKKEEEFLPFGIAVFALLLMELLLNWTILRRIP